MSTTYPQHAGCGGPLVPALALPSTRDDEAPLICCRCKCRTWGEPGDLAQATQADLEACAHVQPLPVSPLRPRPPVKVTPARELEQRELVFVVVPPAAPARARAASSGRRRA